MNNKYNTNVIDIEKAREDRRRKRQEILEKKKKKQEKKLFKRKYKPEKDLLQPGQTKEKSKRAKKKDKKNRLIYIIIIVAVFVLLSFTIWQVLFLKIEQNKAEKEYQAALDQKAKLEKELEDVNKPEYIEEQARKMLRMIKPGEILYIFPEEKEESDSE